MAPIIPEGSFVGAAKWLTIFPVKAGQKLIIKHPTYGKILKTVAIVDKNGFIWSKGENNNSVSVEELGPIDKQQVLGRVLKVFIPR